MPSALFRAIPLAALVRLGYDFLGDDETERQKNLSLFKAWVGNWTLKRLPELTKEELAGIKVKY